MRLDFKFRESVENAERLRLIKSIQGLGASAVAPLFPDEADGELASLYKAEIPEQEASAAVSALESLDEVEFVERSQRRSLIR